MNLMLIALLTACGHSPSPSSTSGTTETGSATGPTDPAAHADITFTYQPSTSTEEDFAFTLRHNDPVTGSGYADRVEVAAQDFDDGMEWLTISHIGCPDGYGTDVTLPDRPPYFYVTAPIVYEAFQSALHLDLDPNCAPEGTDYALWCREDVNDPYSIFHVQVTDDDGELVTGTLHAVLTCTSPDGNSIEGHAMIDGAYVARRISEAP